MRLDTATWPEVDAYLAQNRGIVLPTGSTEQHGPIGLIGTDTICAEAIALRAAERAGALVAPPLGYTPAPFNTGFPGTVSISADLFARLAGEIITGLIAQGFERVYVLNGHGANIAPLRAATSHLEPRSVRLRSWWDFAPVNTLRQRFYGDWEGMHATPSEVAITRAIRRTVDAPEAETPPRKLSRDFIAAHAGDRHGPPDAHRAAFPDGRVGSHSTLARAGHGLALLDAAARAVAEDYQAFVSDMDRP